MWKITHRLSHGSFLDLIFQPGLHRYLGDAGSLVIVPVCNPKISRESDQEFVHVGPLTRATQYGRTLAWSVVINLEDRTV